MKNQTNFVRIEKSKDFSVINNTVLRDERLSWKAKGILVYLLHLPDNWVVNLNEVATHSKDGYDSFKSGISELKKFGYVERKQTREEGTGFIKWETVIREIPLEDKPQMEKPQREKPLGENPLVENPHLLNTNKLITNKINTNNKTYVHQNVPAYEKDLNFEKFWNTYNKKVGKSKAMKAFDKVAKKHSINEIIEHTLNYMDYLQAKDSSFKYQTYPTKFLNEFNLEDDYVSLKNSLYEEKQNFTKNGNKGYNPYGALENELRAYEEEK